MRINPELLVAQGFDPVTYDDQEGSFYAKTLKLRRAANPIRNRMKTHFATVVATCMLIAGCSGSPGPLEGTWKANGLIPMTITFRPGETETLGVIEHVDYKVEGNTVQLTYKDGLMKGASMRFVLVDHDTATNPMYTLRRVR